MKHSVNGKSFDEIFAQRGKGDSHLHLNKNGDIWLKVGTSSCLCFDGYIASFLEATPDQIDLLNSYQ